MIGISSSLMNNTVVVVDNVRSAHNVGAIFRLSDGMAVSHVYLCGITAYPEVAKDQRLPHIRQKMTKAINKTALGATETVSWSYHEDTHRLVEGLKRKGYLIAALEQVPESKDLREFKPANHTAYVIGNEVNGVSPEVLSTADICLEMPMFGKKESHNVVSALAMALYQNCLA